VVMKSVGTQRGLHIFGKDVVIKGSLNGFRDRGDEEEAARREGKETSDRGCLGRQYRRCRSRRLAVVWMLTMMMMMMMAMMYVGEAR